MHCRNCGQLEYERDAAREDARKLQQNADILRWERDEYARRSRGVTPASTGEAAQLRERIVYLESLLRDERAIRETLPGAAHERTRQLAARDVAIARDLDAAAVSLGRILHRMKSRAAQLGGS